MLLGGEEVMEEQVKRQTQALSQGSLFLEDRPQPDQQIGGSSTQLRPNPNSRPNI
jgi:hypothetical protein